MDIHNYTSQWWAAREAEVRDWFETLRFDEPDLERRVDQDMLSWYLALATNSEESP